MSAINMSHHVSLEYQLNIIFSIRLLLSYNPKSQIIQLLCHS